jgi:probable HAF family extracellular repeat protein
VAASAAPAPAITRIFEAPGPVSGGLAGDGSNLYFTTLAKRLPGGGWNYSQVISLTDSGSLRWAWNNDRQGPGGNMRMVPTINETGSRLFVGTDHGKVFCMDTAVSPPQRVVWQWQMSGTVYPVRSGIAYDPTAPKAGGGTEPAVYFQANDGQTYSLNATTGAVRWQQDTGNLYGPPPAAGHPDPWSSTPVIDLYGNVFVGSANGFVYCLNPSTGAVVWRVRLNATDLSNGAEPVEATPAIGENGWLYVATRSSSGVGSISHLYAIDPSREAANHQDAQEKIVWSSFHLDWNEPGVIAGLVVDQCGTVMVPIFHSLLYRFDGTSGEMKGDALFTNWKLCQAPALNRNGLLILGTSTDSAGLGERSILGFQISPEPNASGDWVTTTWGNGAGVFGDFLGGVLLRANSQGWAYLADANLANGAGAVYRLNSGSPSMPGDWPTLGCGNRRHHKARTYPYTLIELGPFYEGSPSAQGAFSVDALGRVVGYAHGNPVYPENYLPNEWYGAWWQNHGWPNLLGTDYTAIPRQWARAINLAGLVVGYSTYGSVYGPIVWTSLTATPQALPLPPGYSAGEARDISADNTIVGFSNYGANPQVLRWDYDGATWVPLPIGAPGGGKAYAYALSNQRRICGKALFTPGGQWQGYTSPPYVNNFSTIQPLGTFGGAQSEAWEVHDIGGTAGWAHKRIGSTDYPRAFRVPPDIFTLDPTHELPGFAGQQPNSTWRSYGYGINGSGQVVGSAQNTSGAYRAYLWQPGWANLMDLSALAPSGWVLTSAAAISDAGHIVGSGTKNGNSRQWLMYPTPQE